MVTFSCLTVWLPLLFGCQQVVMCWRAKDVTIFFFFLFVDAACDLGESDWWLLVFFLSPEGAEWKCYNSIICQEIRPKRRLSSSSWQHSLGSIFLPLQTSLSSVPSLLSSFTTYSVSSPPFLPPPPQGPWLDNWGINSYMKSVNATVSFLHSSLF